MVQQKKFLSSKVHLTATNRRKLLKGEPTLLKHDQLSGGELELFMSPMKHKKLMKAHTQNKGAKLVLTPEEMEFTIKKGGKVADFFKKAGRKIADSTNKALRTYREEVRPKIAPQLKEIVKQGIEKGVPLAVGMVAPELAPVAGLVASRYSDQGATELGRLTGAYGLPKTMHLSGFINKDKFGLPRSGGQLQDNGSNFLNINHPAMNPALNPPDNSRPRFSGGKAGGSFKTAGKLITYGTPQFPALPPPDNSMPRFSR